MGKSARLPSPTWLILPPPPPRGRTAAPSGGATRTGAARAARPTPSSPTGRPWRGELHRLADRALQQHVRRGDADGAAIPVVPRVGETAILHAALDADAVAAEGIHVLEGGVRTLEAPAVAGPAEALADEIAVDHGYSGSSPRAALWR